MLGKLLKYDFRALGRVMLPLQLCVLAGGVVGSFLVNLAVRGLSSSTLSSSSYSGSSVAVIQRTIEGSSSLMGMLIMGLVFSSAIVTLILIAQNLYKSFLTDEAYLTFTLPISTGKHLLSKTICGMVWLLINALILVAILVIFSLVAFSTSGIFSADAIRTYGTLFRELATPIGIVFTIESVLLGFISLLFALMQVYMSLIAGGALARTHKVLAAVGIYFGSSMILQTGMSIVTIALMVEATTTTSYYTNFNFFVATQPFMIVSLVINLALVVVFYFISYRILKSRVNLD